MSETNLRKRQNIKKSPSKQAEEITEGISYPDLRNVDDSQTRLDTLKSHKRSSSFSGGVSDFHFTESVSRAVEHAEEFMSNIMLKGWNVVHHVSLPGWLRDNDYLIFGHRPQIPSFKECFISIFRMHTETMNIWTHLIGFVIFLVLSFWFILQPNMNLEPWELLVVSIFFLSALLSLGFSWVFHTVYCHSEGVKKFFNKLDYAGISILTIGSFVPWLHFSFYCHPTHKVSYMIGVICLGILCVVVSTKDSFQAPKYRSFRAALFVTLGASGVIPCLHFIHLAGFWDAILFPPLGWLVLMAILYVTGAVIYAMRIPERWSPGRFDIWFQSHQIFHVFVVLAAYAHYKGILHFADYRREHPECIGGDAL
ncbi:Adiponectin receptor protein 1 [Cichlidogyrus casuarinus]|uniref:Adiponectin receptor protein 1 n=1 Tax=Cichlidogyrus casuarinus TaxID=1844966 RepID=A0ABD2QBU3_9PLAT